MLKTLRNLALSAMVGAGALAAVPAQADSIYFSFGGHGGPRAGFSFGESSQVRHWDRNPGKHWDKPRHWNKPKGCSPERALNKAHNMGINRVRLDNVDRHTITVRGRDRGHRVYVTFARAPGCPLIG